MFGRNTINKKYYENSELTKQNEDKNEYIKNELNALSQEKYENKLEQLEVRLNKLENRVQKVCENLVKSFDEVEKMCEEIYEDIKNIKSKIHSTDLSCDNVRRDIIKPNSIDLNRNPIFNTPHNTELQFDTEKNNCEIFNEQINSHIIAPQFKSINLSCESGKMVEGSEYGIMFFIVDVDNDNFELYPNHRIKELRVMNAIKDVYEVERKGESKIIVDKPCILRKLSYGYGIEAKGRVRIL